MTRGDIVLLRYPFTDGISAKVRPAIVIAADVGGSDDFIALVVSSRFREPGQRWHVCVREGGPDFVGTGLARTSYIRCDQINTFERRMALRHLGRLPDRLMAEVGKTLAAVLGIS